MYRHKPARSKRKHATPASIPPVAAAAAIAAPPVAQAPQTPAIVYHDNIVGRPELIHEYKELLLKIVRGEELSGMHFSLKEMPGHRIYTLRLKGKQTASRLLFGLTEVGKQKVLVLFGVIENHRYDRSPLRDKRLIRELFIKHSSDIEHATSLAGTSSAATAEGTSETRWNTIDVLPKNALPWMQGVQDSTLEYLNGELLFLGKTDRKAINYAKLPMTLTGPSGSGKSSNGILLMKRALAARDPHNPEVPRYHEIVYITRNERLAVRHKEMFETSVDRSESPDTRVYFETPDAWVRRMNPALQTTPFVGDKEFFEWYKSFVRTRNNQQKTTKGKHATGAPHRVLTPETVRDEMRIACGYDKAQYCNPGRHWTSLPNTATGSAKESPLHAYVWQVLEAWQCHLASIGAHDPAVSAHKCRTPPGTLLVVDEAPDLSWLQLKELLLATPDMSVVFCAGPMQNLDGDISCIPYLLKLPQNLTNGARQMQHINLPHTHRLPPNLLPLTNLSIAIAHHFSGASFSGEFARVRAAPCQVSRLGDAWWLDNPSPETWQRLEETSRSTQCIVVAPAKWLEEAQSRFPKALVLQPFEAKGLQAEAVILYGFLSTRQAIQMSRELPEDFQAPTEGASATANRAHIDARNTLFNRFNNGFFASITRARLNLVFVNPHTSAPHLSALVKKRCTRFALDERDLCDTTPATDADWITRILEVADDGLPARAEALYQQRFRKSGCTFKEFLAIHRPAPQEPQPMAPVCSSSNSSEPARVPTETERGIQELSQDFKKRRAYIANALMKAAQNKDFAPLRHWLTDRGNLLSCLNVNQLFMRLSAPGGKFEGSLFGVLCNALSGDAHELLHELFACNPGVTASLANHLRERAENPESPFMPARADLMELWQLGFTVSGQAILGILALAGGLEAATVISAAQSHVPSDLRDILRELRLLRESDWARALSLHQEAGQTHYALLARVALSMRAKNDMLRFLWEKVVQEDHENQYARAMDFIQRAWTYGISSQQMTVQETTLLQRASLALEELPPESRTRSEMATVIEKCICDGDVPINSWAASTLARLRDALCEERAFLKTLHLTPGGQWESKVSNLKNKLLVQDVYSLITARTRAQTFLAETLIETEGAENLPAGGILQALFKKYDKTASEHPPLLMDLLRVIENRRQTLTWETALVVLRSLLGENTLDRFGDFASLAYEVSEYCNSCKNPGATLARVAGDERLRQAMRLFTPPPAATGSSQPAPPPAPLQNQRHLMQMMFTCPPDGRDASLLNTLRNEQSLALVARLISSIPSFTTLLSFDMLCRQLAGTPGCTSSSFLYWLCARGEEERHRLLEALLDGNPVLLKALQDEIQKACILMQYEPLHADFMWMAGGLDSSETGKNILTRFATLFGLPMEKLMLALWNCHDADTLALLAKCHARPSLEWLAVLGDYATPHALTSRQSMLLAFMKSSNKTAELIWQAAAGFHAEGFAENDVFMRMHASLVKVAESNGGASRSDIARIPAWKDQLFEATDRSESALRAILMDWLELPMDRLSPLAGLLRVVRDDLRPVPGMSCSMSGPS